MRIVAVSYMNTWPFIYGLRHYDISTPFDLQLEVPSVCADMLLHDKADIGLIPTGMLPHFSQYTILTEYCIGAVGKVDSVVLLSRKKLSDIQTLFLDTDSRTSVQLAKILAKHFWKINPSWETYIPGTSPESVVLIGDKTFEKKKEYAYCYDLAEQWSLFTGLPFVFACWVTTKELNNEMIEKLNQAFSWGFNHLPDLFNEFHTSLLSKEELYSYYTKSISYPFDKKKKEGLHLFLELMKQE